MRFPIVVLFLCLVPSAGFCSERGAETDSWRSKSTSHFEIKHESPMAPQSIAIELEKIYSKMRMHISSFAPWTAKEKTKIYIYSSIESYRASSFRPPPWSEALAIPQAHAVVIYDQHDMSEMRRVVSHELSHLFFGSFFNAKPDALPLWLDEGMATNMEDVVLGMREEALMASDVKSYPDFELFTASVPGASDPDEIVRGWYLQAFGAVKYMYSSSNRLKFVMYCRKLLAGSTPEAALWEVYRIRGWKIFDERWRAWLEAEQADFRQGSSSSFTGLKRSNSFSTPSFLN